MTPSQPKTDATPDMNTVLSDGTAPGKDLPPARANTEARYLDALVWALGAHETDGFRERYAGDPPYWWRKELAERAGLAWDGEKFIAPSEAQHTPLPWKAVTPCPGECCWHVVPATFDETHLKEENWHEFINLPEMSEADAKLIVRCVNSHAALLAAAKCAQSVLFLLQDEVKALGCNAKNVPDMLRAAIALATKEPT